MEPLRKSCFSTILVLLLLLACARPAGGFSVLTHEEVIDLTWGDAIQPLLLKRYPNLTPAQLREARAYAYGGCVIQDLGYYPFGKEIFSDLLHYVRTGDFIRALFREAKGPNDLAFAVGALAHYYGDTLGHPEAIDLAVAANFPELAAKYGPNVNYAEGKRQHVRTEFAFDVNDITKHRLAPLGYLNHIGFAVPVPLLSRAFYDTYGLDMAKVLGEHRPTLEGYRFAVRTLLPRIVYAEAPLHRKQMPADVSSPELDEFTKEVAVVAVDDRWARYRGHAGFGTHLLAGFIFVVPKVGPLGDLAIVAPTSGSEQDYVKALMHTTDSLRQTLGQALRSDGLANKDLDTGDDVKPGTYSLEDYAYAKLLHQMTRDPGQPIPFGIKRDLLAYFSDLAKVKYVAKKRKLLAQVQADLPILKTISTKAAYPESALQPEPEEDKPDAASPTAGPAASPSSVPAATKPQR